MTSALLAVPVEIRVLDVEPRVDRVFRLAHSIAEDALRLEREAPYERGRPVRVMLSLPDDETPLVAEGRIERADLIALLQLSAEAKAQIARYVRERNLLP